MAHKDSGGINRVAGKHVAAITMPNGEVRRIGEFTDREEARRAYIAEHTKVYPVPPPAPPKPGTVTHDLTAEPFTTGAPKSSHE